MPISIDTVWFHTSFNAYIIIKLTTEKWHYALTIYLNSFALFHPTLHKIVYELLQTNIRFDTIFNCQNKSDNKLKLLIKNFPLTKG